jgi:hypothetical protein
MPLDRERDSHIQSEAMVAFAARCGTIPTLSARQLTAVMSIAGMLLLASGDAGCTRGILPEFTSWGPVRTLTRFPLLVSRVCAGPHAGILRLRGRGECGGISRSPAFSADRKTHTRGGCGCCDAKEKMVVKGRQFQGRVCWGAGALRLSGGRAQDASGDDFNQAWRGNGGGLGSGKKNHKRRKSEDTKRTEKKAARHDDAHLPDEASGAMQDQGDSAGTLVFSSDANLEQIQEGLKRQHEELEAELDSSEHADALMQELDYQLRQTARALKAKGIEADPERLKKLLLDEQQEAHEQRALDSDADDTPTAWRIHGDRRYPVEPGFEDFDPLAGPNSRQLFMNQEGIEYSFVEGGTRLWPRRAVNDTNPAGFRWVDQFTYPENFGYQAPWKRQDGDPDSRES